MENTNTINAAEKYQAICEHHVGCGCENGPIRDTKEEAEMDLSALISEAGSFAGDSYVQKIEQE